jgi:RsiW-degrading membrane proteinase PrsW (M82 family)
MSDLKFRCPHCHQLLKAGESVAGQQIQCASCSRTFTAIPLADVLNEPKSGNDVHKMAGSLSSRLTSLTGVENLEGFNLKELFSEVFRKHTNDELEEYFTVGTPGTTPSILRVDTSWPRPWVFFRTFVGALIVYILFLWSWNEFRNVNLVPGLIVVGSFAVPIATLIFFVEMNARRNVSLYQVVRLVFMGGIISLILSLILFEVTSSLKLGWLGASVAGLAEEPGKLLALLTVTSIPKYKYKLNGLLFGAAVGTGFAAFESAGYALRAGLFDAKLMTDMIMERGMLSPFAHIAWTAIAGCALWRVKGESGFSISMLQDGRFLKLFALPVVLHMLWNSPIELPFYGKYIILGLVAWIVILGLIQEGLGELRTEKAEAEEKAGKEPILSS